MSTKQSSGQNINTFRLLQQEIVRSYSSSGSKYSPLINPANVLLVIIAGLATYGTYNLAVETNSIGAAVFTLIIQTAAVFTFFVSDRFDKLSIRILLGSYLGFYAVVLLLNGGIATAPYFMLTYILFAFVGVGAPEAFIWIFLQASVIGTSIFVDQTNSSPLLRVNTVSFFAITYFLLTAFAYLMDHMGRLMVDRVNIQAKSLEIANAQYDVILNSIGEGLIATDRKGRVEFVNKQALNILKMERLDVLGKEIEKIIPLHLEGESTNALNPILGSLKNKESITLNHTSSEIFYTRLHDGSSFPVSISVNPVMVTGRLKGVIALFHNMTKENEIDRAKSEFVSFASHQLRTPLNINSWYVEKLLNKKHGTLNEKQADYINEISENNRRMLDLVTDLLMVSRMDLGKLNGQEKDVEIIGLINSLIQEVSPLIKQKNIDLSFSSNIGNLNLKNSDPTMLTVIFQNLITNATKYTLEHGRIDINLRHCRRDEMLYSGQLIKAINGEGIVFSVKDSGIGIPKNEQAKIFEKLYRADNAKTVDVNGTGLGLYVAKNFTEKLGGNLWFISEESKGSEFCVYLPSHRPKESKK